MSRSLKKGPYVDEKLLAKVERAPRAGAREPIKTWARDCTVIPEFIAFTFLVHNGRTFIKVYITEDMIGHKLGEFAPTRTFKGHSGGKGKKQGFAMEYKAVHRYADMSPRKIRPFAALIRGRQVEEAIELLKFLPNKSARLLEQVLKSAVGNAEDRGAHDIETLEVSESRVDGGPIMKRIMPRARGTAYPIKRRYAHIHVTLSDD